MQHKKFVLTRQKLHAMKAKDYVFAGICFGILWTILFQYILPLFVDLFSNSVIALLEELIYPIGSLVTVLLLVFALFLSITKRIFKEKSKEST
jgi:hypothetical protein